MKEDQLLEQIKSAAENAKSPDFPGMEKIWNRVEEKLDNKLDQKAVWRWKKIAIAASFLLFGMLGYEFFYNRPHTNNTNEVVTNNESNPLNTKTENKEPIPVPPNNPEIKPEAAKILQSQIKSTTQVALQEETKDIEAGDNNVGSLTSPQALTLQITEKPAAQPKSEEAKSSEVELFANQNNKISTARKEEPLVVIDSKVSKKKLEGMEFDADSLVVLKEPLYIINGVEYTEQEVFGPNPTSPYTPLNKQEIESLTVLQNEKAIELYGNKGKKGVVIITTKNKNRQAVPQKESNNKKINFK